MRAFIKLASDCLKETMKIVIDDITFYANEDIVVDGMVVGVDDDNCGCIHLDFDEQLCSIEDDKVSVMLKRCIPWVLRGNEVVYFDVALIEDKFKDGTFDVVCPYAAIHDQEVTIEDFKVISLAISANGSNFEPNIDKISVEV